MQVTKFLFSFEREDISIGISSMLSGEPCDNKVGEPEDIVSAEDWWDGGGTEKELFGVECETVFTLFEDAEGLVFGGNPVRFRSAKFILGGIAFNFMLIQVWMEEDKNTGRSLTSPLH